MYATSTNLRWAHYEPLLSIPTYYLKVALICILIGIYTILSLKTSFYLIILSSSNLETWAKKIVTPPAQVQKYITML